MVVSSSLKHVWFLLYGFWCVWACLVSLVFWYKFDTCEAIVRIRPPSVRAQACRLTRTEWGDACTQECNQKTSEQNGHLKHCFHCITFLDLFISYIISCNYWWLSQWSASCWPIRRKWRLRLNFRSMYTRASCNQCFQILYYEIFCSHSECQVASSNYLVREFLNVVRLPWIKMWRVLNFDFFGQITSEATQVLRQEIEVDITFNLPSEHQISKNRWCVQHELNTRKVNLYPNFAWWDSVLPQLHSHSRPPQGPQMKMPDQAVRQPHALMNGACNKLEEWNYWLQIIGRYSARRLTALFGFDVRPSWLDVPFLLT